MGNVKGQVLRWPKRNRPVEVVGVGTGAEKHKWKSRDEGSADGQRKSRDKKGKNELHNGRVEGCNDSENETTRCSSNGCPKKDGSSVVENVGQDYTGDDGDLSLRRNCLRG